MYCLLSAPILVILENRNCQNSYVRKARKLFRKIDEKWIRNRDEHVHEQRNWFLGILLLEKDIITLKQLAARESILLDNVTNVETLNLQ